MWESFYFSILIAGFGGGMVRSLVGFFKQFSYKTLKFETLYFFVIVFIFGLLTAVVTKEMGLNFFGLGEFTPALAFIVGYAGGDFLESVYKIIVLKKPLLKLLMLNQYSKQFHTKFLIILITVFAVTFFAPSAVHAAYRNTIEADSPLYYWTMDASAGATSLTAAVGGTAINLTGATAGASGQVDGTAVSFNGTSNFGATASSINLTAYNKVVVEAIVYFNNYNTAGPTIGWELGPNTGANTTGFYFAPKNGNSPDNKFAPVVKGNTGYNYGQYNQATAGAWHHVVAIYDKSAPTNEVSLYVDGQVQTAETWPVTLNNTNTFGNAILYLMSRAGTSLFSIGSMQHLAIYSNLSSGSILAHAQAAGLLQFTAGTLSESSHTSTTATMSWTSSTNGTNPIIEQLQRSPNGAGTWSNVSGATTSPATDSGLSSATSYDYRVVYTDSTSTTAYSNTVSITTIGPFTAGTLSESSQTSTTATMSWTSSINGTNPITEQLQRSPNGAGTWSNVSGATTSPATDSGLSSATSYDYRVVYTDSTSTTAYSNTVIITTYPLYSANSNIVIAGPYDTAVSGSPANWGNTGLHTSIDILNIGHQYRIRQNGTISAARLYTVDKTALTGFYITVYRLSGSTYTLVGQSENLVSQLVAGDFATTTFASPITGVQEGDYYGMRVESPSGSSYNFFARTGQTTVSGAYVFDQVSSPTSSTWTGGSYLSASGTVMPVELYMQAPQTVFIGDSIISGHNSNYSFLITIEKTDIASTIEKQFSNLTGYTYQNMGIGGQNTSQISARFTTDVINLHPRIAIIEAGVNDLAQSVSKSVFITNWTSMLDAAQASNSITKILVMKVLPWSNGTNVQMQTRDDWNASLVTLAAGYSKAIVVDTSSYVGQFRSGGDAGNLWNIKAAYNADGVHFTSAGHGQIAQALAQALADNLPSTATSITSFNFASPSVTGTVDNTAHTVALTVPFGTTVTSLTPTIVLATGATISPNTGVAQNFSSPVTYTVTAEDGTTNQTYAVTVTVAPIGTHTIIASAGTNGSISPSGSVSVNNESDQSFTITSSSGYHIDTVTADGGAVSATSPYTFTNVTADHTISATFTATTININTSSSPFIPPTKPNITNIDITVLDNGTTTFNLPSNITQIAISRTPDFTNVSWQDFYQDKFSHINETQETLYLKFRTNEGAVSDTIIITPQTSINNTISLIDGDIIQCKSSNDPNAVYIVKMIGTKTYIRHITSIQIFNYYKHLKWENLKQVDSLTPFSLSSWIRVNTGTNGLPKAGDKVYEINGDQTKHWINMTSSQFLSHGGSDEAIYTVNTGELNLYSAGPDVMSL